MDQTSHLGLGCAARMLADPNMHFDRKAADRITTLFTNTTNTTICSSTPHDTQRIKNAVSRSLLLKHVSWNVFSRFISALYNWYYNDGKFESSDWRLLCTAAKNYSDENGIKTHVQHEIFKHCKSILQPIKDNPSASDNLEFLSDAEFRDATKKVYKQLQQLRSTLQELLDTGESKEAIQQDIERIDKLLTLLESKSKTVLQAKTVISETCGIPQDRSTKIDTRMAVIDEIDDYQQERISAENIRILKAYGELESTIGKDLPVSLDTIEALKILRTALSATDSVQVCGFTISR